MHAADRMREHAPVDNFVDTVVCLWITLWISLREHLRIPGKNPGNFLRNFKKNPEMSDFAIDNVRPFCQNWYVPIETSQQVGT